MKNGKRKERVEEKGRKVLNERLGKEETDDEG